MRRAVVAFTISFILCSQLTAQQALWTWVNPYPTGEQINQAYFKSSLEGFLLGNRGLLLRTTDAGNTWQQTSVAQNVSLYKMFFVTPSIGWVVGPGEFSGSYLLRTSDGGVTWSGQPLPGPGVARDLFFLSTSAGWIVGENGLILQTTNGGATWQDRSIGVTFPPSFYFVRFTSPTNGVALGKTFAFSATLAVARTTNGGSSWALQTTGLQNNMTAADQASASSLVTVGSGGLVLKSMDVGHTWSFPMGLPTTELTAIDFYDSLLGVAVGYSGRISRTNNGGTVWTEILPGITQILNSVQFLSQDSVVASGNGTGFPTSWPAILVSTDGGFVWNNKARFIEDQFFVRGISVYARGRCWIAGDRFIYGTVDSGLSWRQMRSTSGDELSDIVAMDSLNGIAVGTRSFSQGLILRTTNAGNTWTAQTFGITSALLKAAFPSRDTGYVVGASGTILKTTNMGLSWVPLNSGSTNYLSSVKFASTQTGWVTSGSDVLKTTNGGSAWIAYTVSQDAVQAMSFPTPSVGYASTSFSLYKTSNGGLTWSPVFSSLFGIYDLAFTDANRGWSMTDNLISTTTDGGVSWTTEFTYYGLTRLGLLPGQDLWAGGQNTTLLRYAGSPVVSVSEDPAPAVPNVFSLKQNSPNPFNPTTVIAYDIPVTGKVELTIYDIVGREVARLVNELQPPGTYQVTWNAGGFASGVYFYRLRAGSFSETKRLLLLK